MENNTRAFSTLEDGLTYIEHYFRIDLEAITQLINNMVKTLPEEPNEYWMFACVFMIEGMAKHRLWLNQALQSLFDSFDMPDGAPEYEAFVKKISALFDEAMANTKYYETYKQAMKWRNKEWDNAPLLKDGQWVRSH